MSVNSNWQKSQDFPKTHVCELHLCCVGGAGKGVPIPSSHQCTGFELYRRLRRLRGPILLVRIWARTASIWTCTPLAPRRAGPSSLSWSGSTVATWPPAVAAPTSTVQSSLASHLCFRLNIHPYFQLHPHPYFELQTHSFFPPHTHLCFSTPNLFFF